MDEKKNRKIYYSMGEVAEMFDVNQSLIRFWEQKFDVLKPHKNKKGNRMFTPEDVENLKLIYHLVKEKGMTLSGAQKRIRDNKEGINRDMEIIDRLMSIKAILQEIRQELKSDEESSDAAAPPAVRVRAVAVETVAVSDFSDAGTGDLPASQDAAAAKEPIGPQPRIIEQTLF